MTTRTSTFSSTTTFIDGNNGGSRLLVQISDASCVGGVTAGDVIHYDAINDVYRKSIADNPVNAEVFGIVESVNIDASKNVVIYGSIDLPSISIEDVPAGSTGAGGGADVYFLSPTTEGKIRNTTPTELTQIVKAVYQVAPHGIYTGLVMNYIGYKVPSEVNIFTPRELTTPVGTLEYRVSDTYTTISTISAQNYIDVEAGVGILDNNLDKKYEEFKNKYQNYFGKTFKCRFEPVALVGTAQGSHPLWNTANYPAITTAYVDRVDVDILVFQKSINMVDKTFNVCINNELANNAIPFDQTYPGPIQLGSTYYLGQTDTNFTPIGGIIITEIFEDPDTVYFPSIEKSHKQFRLYDQNDNLYGNNAYEIKTYLKIKSQNVANNVRSLEANTLETQNFTLNNEDLITILNDFNNRIQAAEVEINK